MELVRDFYCSGICELGYFLCLLKTNSGYCVVSLTEHVDDIVKLIFQYLNLLKKEGPQKWVFDECKVSNFSVIRALLSADCGASFGF